MLQHASPAGKRELREVAFLLPDPGTGCYAPAGLRIACWVRKLAAPGQKQGILSKVTLSGEGSSEISKNSQLHPSGRMASGAAGIDICPEYGFVNRVTGSFFTSFNLGIITQMACVYLLTEFII